MNSARATGLACCNAIDGDKRDDSRAINVQMNHLLRAVRIREIYRIAAAGIFFAGASPNRLLDQAAASSPGGRRIPSTDRHSRNLHGTRYR